MNTMQEEAYQKGYREGYLKAKEEIAEYFEKLNNCKINPGHVITKDKIIIDEIEKSEL